MRRSMRTAVHARLEGSEPRYWPIQDYGVIGDCRTAALVAPNGSIDWACLPHFDSPAALCRLLDHDKGGYLQTRPAEACDAAMGYVPATNVLETTFSSPRGEVTMLDLTPVRTRQPHPRILEALEAVTPFTSHGARSHLEREIGNDVAAAHRIDRVLTCTRGESEIVTTLRLTPKYAAQVARLDLRSTSRDTCAAVLTDHDEWYVFVAKPLSSPGAADDAPTLGIEARGGALVVTVRLTQGQRFGIALNFARDQEEAERLLGMLMEHDFDDDVAETLDYWQGWSDICAYEGPYQDQVLRSALALKLCVFEPSGAIIAAPTTSLPEDIGGERNWDYRYTWLRDSSLTLHALGVLGYHNEARDYFHFLHDLHVRNGDQLRVMFTVSGKTGEAIAESELNNLDGYMGSRPVRVGNGAVWQRQMDIYGELADAALRYAVALGYCSGPRSRESPRDLRQLMTLIGEYVADHWQDQDRSIWEVRGPERAFVYSRAMCWVALDRALQIAGDHVSPETRERWSNTARQIRRDIDTHGFSPRLNAYIQAYGDEAMDAANLRLALVGYLPPTDPRIHGTVEAIGKALSSDGALLYRYQPTDGGSQSGGAASDGLPGTEGAFLACAFWYVSNLAMIGRVDEARERFEELQRYASPLGLYSEEIDPRHKTLLGNFPQAFTHIGLAVAANQLAQATAGKAPSR